MHNAVFYTVYFPSDQFSAGLRMKEGRVKEWLLPEVTTLRHQHDLSTLSPNSSVPNLFTVTPAPTQTSTMTINHNMQQCNKKQLVKNNPPKEVHKDMDLQSIMHHSVTWIREVSLKAFTCASLFAKSPPAQWGNQLCPAHMRDGINVITRANGTTSIL